MTDTIRVYLDACCVCRVFDDSSQLRVRQEAEAIESILLEIQNHSVLWIASSALEMELMSNPDDAKRRMVLSLLKLSDELWIPDLLTSRRARHFVESGYGDFDALHLALAETAKADVLVTTDDKFLRKVRRGSGIPAVRAENPLNWRQKVRP